MTNTTESTSRTKSTEISEENKMKQMTNNGRKRRKSEMIQCAAKQSP